MTINLTEKYEKEFLNLFKQLCPKVECDEDNLPKTIEMLGEEYLIHSMFKECISQMYYQMVPKDESKYFTDGQISILKQQEKEMENIVARGKELAFLLRHDKSYEFDANGWRDVTDLVENHNYTPALLEEIVRTDEKGRYEFNQNYTKIRACQGHSVNVDVELDEKVPPMFLYHGTSDRFEESIKAEGLTKQSRLYVHLSKEPQTAAKVGQRHGGNTIIYRINAFDMYQDGFKFFKSKNNVWLVDSVPVYYLEKSDFNISMNN